MPLLSINNVNKGTTQMNYNFKPNDNSNCANKAINAITFGKVTTTYNMTLSGVRD